jgi:UDP-N-acetylmuramoylalanine--D-glutamate ligase
VGACAIETECADGGVDWRRPDPYCVARVPWHGLRVCVVGARALVGVPVTRALSDLGAEVLLCDSHDDAETARYAAAVVACGATPSLGDATELAY